MYSRRRQSVYRRPFTLLVLVLIAITLGIIVSTIRAGKRSEPDYAALLRDVCDNVRDSYTWLQSATRDNHRLRIKSPWLQRDREANGVYHALIGIDSELAAAYDVCRRVRE